ncbi:MAG TPA: nitroreductase family deazaflavin-dependent oxidoreductase [Micromonosporaceae bacterium]|jgi:deazaflavin-dependent oxidoreductase (nitroreductase family)
MAIEGEYAPSRQEWVRNHVSTITDAGTTDAANIRGMPVVLMTMRGAVSGKVRKVPVMRVEHDGVYAVVASQGGAPTHPSWYFNLKADPAITLQDGREVHTYLAREPDGAEREQWWERAVAAFPDYAEYQKRTTRRIPLLVLERTD